MIKTVPHLIYVSSTIKKGSTSVLPGYISKPSTLLRKECDDLVLFLLRDLGPRLHMHPDGHPLLMRKGRRRRGIMTPLAILRPQLCTRFGSHLLALRTTVQQHGHRDGRHPRKTSDRFLDIIDTHMFKVESRIVNKDCSYPSGSR